MQAIDWLTIIVVGLGAFILLCAAAAKHWGHQIRFSSYTQRYFSKSHSVNWILLLLVLGFALQFFRAFTVTVEDFSIYSNSNGAIIKGKLYNPHSFKVRDVVVRVSLVATRGNLVKTDEILVKQLTANGSCQFSAPLNSSAPVGRIAVTAKGFWMY